MDASAFQVDLNIPIDTGNALYFCHFTEYTTFMKPMLGQSSGVASDNTTLKAYSDTDFIDCIPDQEIEPWFGSNLINIPDDAILIPKKDVILSDKVIWSNFLAS